MIFDLLYYVWKSKQGGVEMFDFSKLIGLMAEKGFSQKKLSQILSMSENSFSRKIIGKSYFNSQEIAIICNTLGISAEQVGVYFFTPKV